MELVADMHSDFRLPEGPTPADTHVPHHEPTFPFLCPVDRWSHGIKGFARGDALIRHARAVHGIQSAPNYKKYLR
ncbi:uncharacterized protein MYCFIDRAFT_211690 [Pseudocercospora fijiensis CIRAD86]|uniref:C2H2-type domain-containing protein n=1 Tax=Pseudocercospora fijiensis (strain CIRAD86) TaxID=383855 RepID=M3ATR4_PSEFD|nr:uncharacterized protein MYCFIDRAFT_211690 [Pseudocercospora fijiensis CIRAD86]EME80872.1 hypothetical protein MYCFIDRAFT_211690 [Pseudocercospora fijiensis CIRAD86]